VQEQDTGAGQPRLFLLRWLLLRVCIFDFFLVVRLQFFAEFFSELPAVHGFRTADPLSSKIPEIIAANSLKTRYFDSFSWPPFC
jgi:hypothetical protein